jgi:hypothetical protein
MPILQMDAEDVKRFIHSRLANNPKFRTVIAISVDSYPQEFFVKVWVGEEPTTEMRQVGYELESELANLGVPCSIIIKTDRELPFGGAYALQTMLGELSYRYHRIDPERDEDEVYVFSLFRGTETYRFRISLTGTLASMLRSRNRLNEERLLTIYRDWIRQEIETSRARPSVVNDKMFNSNDLKLFGSN